MFQGFAWAASEEFGSKMQEKKWEKTIMCYLFFVPFY